MRARGAQAQTGARARRASKAKMRARVRARARPTRARANKLSARANKLSKSQISSPNPHFCRAYLRARVGRVRARASWPCSRTSRARAPLFARASRARACRCSRTSRAHVLNARALGLRTPQLVRHHIWIHMFWIKPNNDYIVILRIYGIMRKLCEEILIKPSPMI